MKRNRLSVVITGIVCALVIGGLLGNTSILMAADKDTGKRCQIVRLLSNAGIDPPVLKINKGDCVVWLNQSWGWDFKIVFKEGKKCQDMTKAPVGFKMNWKSCYVTDYLDYGRTASLLFDQPGTFDYQIEVTAPTPGVEITKAGFQKFGTIEVK